MSFCDKQKSIKTLKNKPKSRYTSRVDFIRKISFEMELILGNETAFVFLFYLPLRTDFLPDYSSSQVKDEITACYRKYKKRIIV